MTNTTITNAMDKTLVNLSNAISAAYKWVDVGDDEDRAYYEALTLDHERLERLQGALHAGNMVEAKRIETKFWDERTQHDAHRRLPEAVWAGIRDFPL